MADWLITKFKENYRGFWKDYRWFLAVFILSVFCDAASTMHFMLIEGPDDEIHAAIRLVSRLLGPVAGPLAGAIGKVAAGILVSIYLRRFAAYILAAASIISFWAAWYNLWGFEIYTPIILKWLSW
ncbi:MAG TPA: hypothetical protein VMW16_10835 [Sedimentisphaerales bacterium]|nr:hypothetical protein [Sedimentisphaerales bacterium]